jgi:phytoene dehydrogenase-like protein
MSEPVVIVGAGLAGLCCGRRLAQCGVPFTILEASDGVGGRVRTDLVDGFRLDRGFQIFLPGYPEARRVLDYDALDLKPFTRGALVRYRGKFRRVADPWVEPVTAARSLLNPVGSLLDKLRLPLFLANISTDELETPTARETTTEALLRDTGGFSHRLVERLWRPFLGGVFLDKTLATSSRAARFVVRTFAAGAGAVPATGMGAIPQQIADALPAGSVRLNAPVAEIADDGVTLATGERVTARAVVVATDATVANKLTRGAVPDPGWNGSTTIYFAAPKPPVDEPILMLNGEPGTALTNSVVVLSNASAAYAPAGWHLISVSVIGTYGPDVEPTQAEQVARLVAEHGLDEAEAAKYRTGTVADMVHEELKRWFGNQVSEWRFLRKYRIPHSLPAQPPGSLDPWRRPVAVRDGVFVCGDHRDNGSIDGAMVSGYRAAQAVMEAVGS